MREGEKVAAGQELVRIDNIGVSASYDEAFARAEILSLTRARLIAERDEKNPLEATFWQGLSNNQEFIKNQQQLYQNRRQHWQEQRTIAEQ